MTFKTAFSMVMVDERYPQKLQHVYIDNFLKRLGYKKSFYGTESEVTKNKSHILIHHLESNIEGDAIVFFSLEQFKNTDEKLDYNLMRRILENGYDLLIAMQEISILSAGNHDLSSIFLIDSSIKSRMIRMIYKKRLQEAAS